MMSGYWSRSFGNELGGILYLRMLGSEALAFLVRHHLLAASHTQSAVQRHPHPSLTLTMAIPSRLAALKQLQCSIFQTSYNPESLRTGAKYLRRRLRGPSMINYYPPELSVARVKQEMKSLVPDFEFVNSAEVQRLQDIEDKKKRGKGAPKKAKSKGAFCLNSTTTCLFLMLYHYSGQPSYEQKAVGIVAPSNPPLLSVLYTALHGSLQLFTALLDVATVHFPSKVPYYYMAAIMILRK